MTSVKSSSPEARTRWTRRVGRWAALLGLVVGASVAVTAVSGVSGAGAATPKTLVGVHTVRRSESGPLSPKTVQAPCAPDEVILGGGGQAIEPGTGRARLLTLTRLE